MHEWDQTSGKPVVNFEEYPFYLRHRGCGGIAFYLKHKPEAGETSSAASAIYPNGEKPNNFTPVRCGTCGAPLVKTPVCNDLSLDKVMPVAQHKP